MGNRKRRSARAGSRARSLRLGARLAGFRVGPLVNEGGMSRIYRVTHPRHSLPMVVKLPRLEAGAPLSAINAFENECRILKRLHGPHVPRFIAADENAAHPFLIMEYIEGDRFARALERAPLSAAELSELALPLCRALHDLHRQNTIHLDLNPKNIRSRANGELVLIDYGLAHHAGLPDIIDSAFGEDEGTTPYISPEQLRHQRSDSRSDIYALGAVLYRLATGQYPYGRPNLMSLKRRLIHPPLPPRFYNPRIPAWLQEVILHCLETSPKNRYPTAKRVAYLLAHPEAVVLTRHAHRLRPSDRLTRAYLWLRSFYQALETAPPDHPHDRHVVSPHILVALDFEHENAVLLESMLTAVKRVASTQPHSYFTCLSVVGRDELAANPDIALERQIAMRRWAKPLRLRAQRIVFHVLDGHAAKRIVDYARQHNVDQIIVGAFGRSGLKRLLGSVSTRVAARAPSTVTIVRPPHSSG